MYDEICKMMAKFIEQLLNKGFLRQNGDFYSETVRAALGSGFHTFTTVRSVSTDPDIIGNWFCNGTEFWLYSPNSHTWDWFSKSVRTGKFIDDGSDIDEEYMMDCIIATAEKFGIELHNDIADNLAFEDDMDI